MEDELQEKKNFNVKIIKVDQDAERNEKKVSLRKKLRKAKKTMGFPLYVLYALNEVSYESDTLFMTLVCLGISVIMLCAGLLNKNECPGSPMIVVCTLDSGIIGILQYAITLTYLFSRRRDYYMEACLRVLRLALFTTVAIGTAYLYDAWIPGVVEKISDFHCNFDFFWTAFFVFHWSLALYAFHLIFIISSLIFYFF